MDDRVWMIIGELTGLGIAVFTLTKWIESPKRWKRGLAWGAGIYAGLSIFVHVGLLIVWLLDG